MNTKIINLESVDSTNEFLKRENLSPITVVTAKIQTQGKGRRGKRWISHSDKGLYISFLFPVPEKIPNIQIISISTATAVAKVLNEFKSEFLIKWPNDILIKGKKICGILPELTKEKLIIGIGINLYHSEKELQGTETPATSLAIEKIEVPREKITNFIIEAVKNSFFKTANGKFDLSDYEKIALIKQNTHVEIKEETGTVSGIALGIDREGFLIVEINGKIKRVFSGDVSVRV